MKKWLYKVRSHSIARISKWLMGLLISTCRVRIEGLDDFIDMAKKEKCLLTLWHNRLAVVPFILERYAPDFSYAALVSGSRDGEILSAIVRSYKQGYTIRATHQARHKALMETIRHVEERKHIVVITPDGPRGPLYAMKPGLAAVALQTRAYIIPIDWSADSCWELNTWDRLRLPKPFTKLTFRFLPPCRFDDPSQISIDEATAQLKTRMNL